MLPSSLPWQQTDFNLGWHGKYLTHPLQREQETWLGVHAPTILLRENQNRQED